MLVLLGSSASCVGQDCAAHQSTFRCAQLTGKQLLPDSLRGEVVARAFGAGVAAAGSRKRSRRALENWPYEYSDRGRGGLPGQLLNQSDGKSEEFARVIDQLRAFLRKYGLGD